MITVVGSPGWRPDQPGRPAGRACEIAIAAADAGSAVEIVGRTGDDAAGDALVLALAAAGVGHVALLRDPSRPTRLDMRTARPDLTAPGLELRPGLELDLQPALEPAARPANLSGRDDPEPGHPRLEPADVALGLRYVPAFGVVVVSDDAPVDVVPACIEAATYAGARLLIAMPASHDLPPDLEPALPADATVLMAPAAGDTAADAAFARMLGTYAAGLDQGRDPDQAFAVALERVGWASVAPGI